MPRDVPTTDVGRGLHERPHQRRALYVSDDELFAASILLWWLYPWPAVS